MWRIGWAPNDWRALTAFLTDAGHAPERLVEAGLSVSRDGRLYDRFRSRITFPIHDVHGSPVAFTARVFGLETTPEGEPLAKYINSPQTPIYDKGRLLFGLDKAKVDIRKQNSCLVVEGNMDAIMASQSGTTHVVATSGTALTLEQLRLVGRYSKALTFCFDADQAGAQATRRAIGLAMSQNFSVNLTTLGDRECKDPADYVRKYGSAFGTVVASAKPALDYYWQAALASYDPASAQSKKAIIASVGPLIRRLTSRVEQSHWVGQIAVLLRVDQASVLADLASVPDDLAHAERADEAPRPAAPILTQDSEPDPVDPASFELLTLLVRDPSLVSLASDVLDMVDSRVAQIIQEPTMLADSQSPHKHLIDMAHMRGGELYAEVKPEELRAYASQLTLRLMERNLRTRRNQLQGEIQLATQSGDHAKVRILLTTFQDYTKQLQDIQSQQSRI
jgi:DNA primase